MMSKHDTAKKAKTKQGDFNTRVYRLVRLIPPGKVLTYGGVAWLLGVPRGARAVGWALHALPMASDVPWHRVINAQGRLSARCEAHDADLQRERLEAEGVQFDETDADELHKVHRLGAIMWDISSTEVDMLLDVQ